MPYSEFATKLSLLEAQIAHKKITLGFDGFVDTIVRVIKAKETGKPPIYFERVAEFGQYILEKSGRNLSIELENQSIKLGGNMPITANALAQYGCEVACLGALGYPQLHSVFEPMAATCELHSFANPGLSQAMEFDDGKIMLGQMEALQGLNWEGIKARIDVEIIVKLFKKSDLIALLNWSELDQSTNIWQGLLKDVLPHCVKQEHRPVGFFDLSDCSKRSETALREMLELLDSFSEYWDLVLSLNLNEAEILHRILIPQKTLKPDLEEIGEGLFETLNVKTLIIHHALKAMAWSKGSCYVQHANFIEKPKIATGAGDHFNAGYCLALLLNLDHSEALSLGHATSYHYLTRGTSPDFKDLLNTLNTRQI